MPFCKHTTKLIIDLSHYSTRAIDSLFELFIFETIYFFVCPSKQRRVAITCCVLNPPADLIVRWLCVELVSFEHLLLKMPKRGQLRWDMYVYQRRGLVANADDKGLLFCQHQFFLEIVKYFFS